MTHPSNQSNSEQWPMTNDIRMEHDKKRSQEETRELVTCVLRQYIAKNGKRLIKNGVKIAAERLDMTPSAVSYLWLRYKKSILEPEKFGIDVSRKKGTGGHRKMPIEVLYAKVKEVPFSQRQTIRSLAPRVGLSKSAMHFALKKGLLKRTTSAIKPHLTPANMQQRLEYCRSFVDINEKHFDDMMYRVDIDEKWFYITTVNASYIIVPGEEPPTRRCKHKSHLIKVMCLTAMARPRENPDRPGKFWDGKIGNWWFVEEYRAQRTTNNRVAGTKLLRPITVTKIVTAEYCVKYLLPAIVAKWPKWSAKRIRIQQDNATPHPKPGTDASINDKLAQLATEGWDIQFVTQPPNSPDCNTLDLAFFRAIQSIQYQTPSKDMEELMANVDAALDDLPLEVCIKVWTTAQMVMNEILLADGNNNYKLPHAGKDKIVRELGKRIPLRLPCTAVLSKSSLNGASIKSTMMADSEYSESLHNIVHRDVVQFFAAMLFNSVVHLSASEILADC
jgi:hypothetical protein